MKPRLLKIADMLFSCPCEMNGHDDEKCSCPKDCPCWGKSKEDDLDLRAEDLSNRLEDAVTAIGDCISILTELGMDENKAKEKIFSIIKNEDEKADKITGGLADGKTDLDFDPEQLKKGIEVELEHTDDPEIAKEIARDHLCEKSDYYDRLEKMEKEE